MSERINGTVAQIKRINIEIPIPPPEPKTCLKIAPEYPNIAEILSCSKTKILDKPTGFNPAKVAIKPSIG